MRVHLEKIMSHKAFWCLLLIAMAASASVTPVRADPSGRAATPASTERAGVSIPNTRRMDFVSKVNGHRYSINVAIPVRPAPAKGYGVLYVIDGDFFFASATEVVRGHANAPEGVVVVGIGYPNDRSWVQSVFARRGPFSASFNDEPRPRAAQDLERAYDLTLPASDLDMAAQTLAGYPKQKSENVGGLDDFLKIIETEVKPRVTALAHIDSANQVLFGDSYGGLAALHALFVEPNAFRTFIIGSPSIWWNNKAVLADEARFAEAVSTGQASPRVIVTMGALESSPLMFPAGWKMDPAAVETYLHMSRMVENGAELVTWLKSVHGGPGYVVADYVVFDKLGHAIAPWPALAWGINFAFPITP
jgi:uncharacterized protein